MSVVETWPEHEHHRSRCGGFIRQVASHTDGKIKKTWVSCPSSIARKAKCGSQSECRAHLTNVSEDDRKRQEVVENMCKTWKKRLASRPRQDRHAVWRPDFRIHEDARPSRPGDCGLERQVTAFSLLHDRAVHPSTRAKKRTTSSTTSSRWSSPTPASALGATGPNMPNMESGISGDGAVLSRFGRTGFRTL